MKNKFQLIQALKAIVALLILVGHMAVIARTELEYNLLPQGLVRTGGVDFFFVLSGFLIYYLYSKNVNNGKEKIFLFKRGIRIYPLIWLFTLISLPIYFFVESFGGGHETELSTIIKSLLLYPQSQPVLGATWSLSHVILFYALFALYLRSPYIMRITALVWTAATLTLWIWPMSESLPYEIHFLFSPFNLEFLLGAATAHLALHNSIKYERLIISSGICLFVFTWLNNINGIIPIETTVMYSLASALIILGAAAIDRKFSMKINKWVDKLGDSSYAIIITNLPFIILITKIFSILNIYNTIGYIAGMLLTMILTTVGGLLVHLIIEQPMHKYLFQWFITKKEKNIINVKHIA